MAGPSNNLSASSKIPLEWRSGEMILHLLFMLYILSASKRFMFKKMFLKTTFYTFNVFLGNNNKL